MTREQGGPIRREEYIVGDRGPERFLAPADGFIYPVFPPMPSEGYRAWLGQKLASPELKRGLRSKHPAIRKVYRDFRDTLRSHLRKLKE